MRLRFLAAGGLLLMAACASRIKVDLKQGDPLPVDAAAIYPLVFRWDEPSYRSFELSEMLALQAMQSQRYAVFGPGEFKLVAASSENPFVGSDLALGLADRGLSPRAAIVFRPWVEKRAQSEVKQVFDSKGKAKGTQVVEEARLLARLEIFHSATREVLARLEASADVDPFAQRDPSDPLPELTELMGELMKKALKVLDERAPGAKLERDFGFEYLWNPKGGFEFAIENRPSFSESIKPLDVLDQDVATEQRMRFFYPKLDDATLGKLKRMPPGLLVTKVGDAAKSGLQPGDLITEVAGEPAFPQTLQRALRAHPVGTSVPIKVRRDYGLVDVQLPIIGG